MDLLTVGVSPHVRSRYTTRNVMLDVIIALMPVTLASVVIFGWRSLYLTAVSVAACVLLEFLWNKLMKQPVTVGDLSAVVTGIIIACNVPVTMPVWQLIVGDATAIIVAKMLFGGLGCNFMNPALVGRIVMFFSFTANMTDYSGHLTDFASHLVKTRPELVTTATPLLIAHTVNTKDLPMLLFGTHGGVLGETCAIAIMIGFVYLLVRRVITPTIPVVYIGGVFLLSWIMGVPHPLAAILSGGLFFGAVYMATDYVTTPSTEKGRAVFGIGCAFITVMIRMFANSSEGVSFAILLMNVITPYIDAVCRTKPFGGAKK